MEYKPLDTDRNEIRLLAILPSEKDSIVRCTLEHISLINPPDYCALSYSWGDPKVTAEIIVNSIPVPVTTNLESALRHLRAKDIGRLWVDAICINQEDKAEKNQQLPWMGSIYRRAREVHAWTGEGDSHFKQAFPSTATKSYTGPIEEEVALLQFLDRPYWRRVWIIQEIALSRNTVVHCGEHDIDWAVLVARISGDGDQSLRSNSSFKNMENLILFQREALDIKPLRFLNALLRSHTALSTDPRDKVFALLGLVYDGGIYLPIPNYKQSIRDLCMSMTVSALTITSSLDIVPFLGLGINKEGFPSWVPNWFNLRGEMTRGLEYLCQLPRIPFNQSRTWSPDTWIRHRAAAAYNNPSISIMSSTLRVQGIVFDQIDGTCPTFDEALMNLETSKEWQSDGICNAYAHHYYEKYRTWEVIAHTLTRHFYRSEHSIWSVWTSKGFEDLLLSGLWDDRNPFKTLDGKEKRVFKWADAVRSFLVGGSSIEEWARMHAGWVDYPNNENWFEAFENYVSLTLQDNMRLMTTRKGYVGWCPPRGRKGDKIYIFQGCSVPVILRARDEGGFFLVGDAYVEGIMDGEVLEVKGTVWSQLEIH